MRKYVEILNKQAQELKCANAQNGTIMSNDELKAIHRIEWIVSSFAAKEIESTVTSICHAVQMKEEIRNGKFDADEKLYHHLLSDNQKWLARISPHSLLRYVPLLEVPE